MRVLASPAGRGPQGLGVPQPQAALAYALLHHLLPGAQGRGRLVGAALRVVAAGHAGEHGQGVGGRGLDTVVGGA